MRRSIEPERQRHDEHEDGRHGGQRQRDRQATDDEPPDGNVVLQRDPELSAQGAAQPLAVLHGEGPVESHRRAQARHDLGVGLGTGHDEDGITGQHADGHEYEDGHAGQRDDERHEPPKDVPAHGIRRAG